ncbi:hypothetical protein TeGR_g14126 [Tetraparma gracilis]|uniref:Endonuclease/exonuclease/phosphatase domain-containing protein n=1 Tax=Tetraparma gracilis TaxID=2962635 RepID=A0ABQ6N9X8_9STRA|nr:hypothetical protein TeGR_g14126 [Tetraparma gracilis]
MPPTIFPPTQSSHLCLASSPKTFSILSYNILLPNSQDGWWIRKNYPPSTPSASREWPHRSALLQAKVRTENPDIVCFQEASEVSHETDHAWLSAAGYDYAVHKKGRMRNMTWWRRSELELDTTEAFCKDRTLITPLKIKGEGGGVVWIVNCHLTAGTRAADRRLRQLHDALETVRKKGRGAGGGDHIVVCGDFNAEADVESAAGKFLLEGEVDAGFMDGGAMVTSKTKRCFCGPMRNAYADAYSPAPPPPTLVGPRLVSRLIREGGGKGATPPSAITPTQGLIEASRAIFFSYADSEDNSRMSRRAVETFLRDINGVATRGSESRKANEILHGKEAEGGGAEGDVMFSQADMLAVWIGELEQGKYWGVAHDIHALSAGFGFPERLKEWDVVPAWYADGEERGSEDELFLGLYDHVFHTGGLRCVGMSDHRALKAVFRMGDD